MAQPTRGSQLLARYVASGHGQVGVAKQISAVVKHDVHQSTISTWASGKHMPLGPMMLALKAVAGIPLEAWGEDPEVAADDSQAVPAVTHDKTGTHGEG